MALTLTFHGAAGCVTGSCARLTGDGVDILVDCGMFQGSKSLKELNYQTFPFDVGGVQAVLLTHAHVDHSGLLPKLMRAGYRGPIFATAATRNLCAVMLADAGDIQEAEVASLNRRNLQRGLPPVEPIYTAEDARRVMGQFTRVVYEETIEVAPGVRARFWPSGHMLGAASVEVILGPDDAATRILFSGDLGSGAQDYLPLPTGPAGIDHLVVESTYGDRVRDAVDSAGRRRLLAEEMRQAHAAGGPLLMPTFAVGRAQELLLDILEIMRAGEAPAGQVFLDSPLAIEATDVFLDRGWNQDSARNPFTPLRHAPNLHYLMDARESQGLEKLRDWHVVLAGSGMCDAGRIRAHLKRLLWRRDVTVLITGYQAMGTLGRLLLDGRKTVRIQGEEVRVGARIRALDVYSAHADAEGLVRWALDRQPIRGRIFLAHGEPEATKGLAARLEAAGLHPAKLVRPELDQGFRLTRTEAEPTIAAPARLAAGHAAALDWHNARADFLSRLNERLEAAPDEAARMRLLARLDETLKAPAP